MDNRDPSKDELRFLTTIMYYLKKVSGLSGDEAFPYVELRNKIHERITLLQHVDAAKSKSIEAKNISNKKVSKVDEEGVKATT